MLLSQAKLARLSPAQLDAARAIYAGVLAWTRESGAPVPVPLLVLLTTAEAESSLDPLQVGDDGTGIGLYQWGLRPDALGSEAIALGGTRELLTDARASSHAILRLAARDGAWVQLCTTGTPAEALRWWTARIERPRDLELEHARRFRLLLAWVGWPQAIMTTGADLEQAISAE